MKSRRHLAVNAVALAPGGGLTYLKNQASALEDVLQDWGCTYFVDSRCEHELRNSLHRSTVQVPFPRTPSLLRRVAWEQLELPRLMSKLGVDVLYNIGGFLSFKAQVPQVLFNQNPNHHAARHDIGASVTLAVARVQRLVALAGARRAAKVIYPTHAYGAEMQRVGFPPPDGIIPSGLALDWGPEEAQDIPRTRTYALAVHNWYRHKRLPWLLEVWNTEPAFAGLDLVLVGQPVDRRTTRQIRKLLASMPRDSHVRVIERASRRELASLYRNADYYLSVSVLEAFPQTPFEAMSFDTPCVLSDIPTHREVAADAAVYFAPGDKASLIEAVQEADEMRSLLIARGRDRIQQYPWAQNAERFAAVFEAAVRETELRGTGQTDVV